jgi:hypothetical protein
LDNVIKHNITTTKKKERKREKKKKIAMLIKGKDQ